MNKLIDLLSGFAIIFFIVFGFTVAIGGGWVLAQNFLTWMGL